MTSTKNILSLLVLFISTLAMAQLPSYVPTDALVAFYPFNGNADDEGPEELDGEVLGAILGPDRNMVPDAAYYFANYYISAPSDADFSSGEGFTVSAWVNLIDPNINQKIVGKTNDSFNSGFVLGVEFGEIYPEIWDANGINHTFNTGFIETDSTMWDHLALTWKSGGYMVAYQNGVAIDSIAASNETIGENDEPLIIGVSPWSQTPTYLATYGGIDDIGIWDRDLSADEILQLFLSSPLNTAHFNKEAILQIFPNPSNDVINIITRPEHIGETYTIKNQLGQILQKGIISLEREVVNISGLPQGIYYVGLPTIPQFSYKIVKL